MILPAAKLAINLKINGSDYSLQVEPRVSLLDALREYLAFTGPKKGCNQGACGACTVLVDGERIISCLALAVQYENREITTIEGLATNGDLHSLQGAFIEHDGFQCGLLHPGTDLLGDRDVSRISEWLAQRRNKRHFSFGNRFFG